MKAREVSIRELYSGGVVYVTPSFQRRYAQSDDACELLLASLLAPVRKPHFMGALVTRELGTTREGFRKALLIDGNRRLMTILTLMLAVRDLMKRCDGATGVAEMNSACFFNVVASSQSPVFKNTVSAPDRAVFEAIVLGTDTFTPSHPLAAVYGLGIDALQKSGLQELHIFADRLLDAFTFVELALARDEDPYPVYKLFNPYDDDVTRFGLDAYTQFSHDPELMELVAGGESQEVEFKECVTRRGGDERTQGSSSVIRAVAAFLNTSSGGTLLIGVADDGRICGIESEYALVDRGKKNFDGYQLFLRNLLRAKLDSPNAFLFYDIEKRNALGHDVCLIRISPAENPVYVDKHFYVRTGAQTLEMLGPDLVNYVRERFG